MHDPDITHGAEGCMSELRALVPLTDRLLAYASMCDGMEGRAQAVALCQEAARYIEAQRWAMSGFISMLCAQTPSATEDRALDRPEMPKDSAHDRAFDVARDLVNGRITQPGRRMIRDALDKADAAPVGRTGTDQALGRAIR